WWRDPDTLCCIIRNLTKISVRNDLFFGKVSSSRIIGNDGVKFLLIVRSLLEMYREFLTYELEQTFSQLFNLIMTLIHNTVQKIIGAYANILRGKLTRWLNKFLDVEKWKSKRFPCLPYDELIDTLAFYVKRIIEEFLTYFASFLTDWRSTLKNSNIMNKKAEKLLKVDFWIYLIDQILSFQKFWRICIDTMNELDTSESQIQSEANAESEDENLNSLKNKIIELKEQGLSNEEIIQNLVMDTTNYKGDTIKGIRPQHPGSDINEVFKKIEEAEEKAESKDKIFDYSKAFGTDGMRVLLSNFIGLSESDVEKVINSTGDCNCDNILTDEDLLRIKEMLS
ncbi:MAG: hypothetical protein ACTSVB_07850, partial [Candidatus Heimdallarchaeaceae archaeon]